MRFVIVVPTIRKNLPGFEETMQSLRDSLTQPSDIIILDGTGGKVPALNRAYEEILVPGDFDVYVTVDDDYVIEPGWQDDLVAAFTALPDAGVVAPYYGDDPEMQSLMGPDSYSDWFDIGQIRVRKLLKMRHIPGGLLAFRREVAVQVGKQPSTGIHYEVYEDAWRGRMVQKLGLNAYYVDTKRPKLITYADPEEYLRQKAADIVESRRIMGEVMGKDNIADPLSWRLRRWVAKLRGRSVD